VSHAATVVVRTASGWVYEHWTVADGLPVNSINDLLQSRDGYLWLATFDGLARFDGLRFRVFDSGNSELPTNRIIDIHEARDGTLWLLAEHGPVVRFRDGVFHTLPVADGTRAPYRILHEAYDGTIWVAGNGVGRIEGDQVIRYLPDELGGRINAVHVTREGVLWVANRRNEVSRVEADRVTRVRVNPSPPADFVVMSFSESADGRLLAGGYGGLWVYEDGALRTLFADPGWEHGPVGAFDSTTDGKLWLETRLGIHALEAGRPERLDPQRISPAIPGGAARKDRDGALWFGTKAALYRNGERVFEPTGDIHAYTFDHEGSVWIGTETDGLWQLKPSLFEIWGAAEGVGSDNIYPVLEDEEGLWIGTYDAGLTLLKDGAPIRFDYPTLPGSLIRALHRDSDGTLWVGFHDRGACRWEGPKCERFGIREGLRGTVLAIYQDRQGAMWFGTEGGGLFRYHDGDLRRFTTDDGLASNIVRVIVETSDGALWFGTNGGGISRFVDGGFRTCSTADGLSSDLIRSIYEDAEGALWIGTEGRGLNRIVFDGDRHETTVFRKSDGLFDEVVHQILEDDFGRLWMSSNRGVFWVTLDELRRFAAGEIDRIRSTSYTEQDGLRSREANGGVQPAGVKGRDGRLWFPTQRGVVAVDPARLRQNEIAPRVVIEEVLAGGESRELVEPVTIPPRGRDLEIAYTALSFLESRNVQLRYRLEGYDRDWVEAGNRRIAYYTNVPPGDYTFQVIAANNDGVWNMVGASLQFAVTPRWFERRALHAVLLGILVLGGVGGYRWRVGAHERRRIVLERLVESRTNELIHEKEASERATAEAEREHEIAQEALRKVEAQAEQLREHGEAKSRFFADVSHEFRTPLTLTIGPLEDLRDGRHGDLDPAALNDVELALRNSRRLLGLINEILEIARLEAGQVELDKRSTDLGELVRESCLPFAALAERNAVTFTARVPDEPLMADGDPELLERVIANLLSNAFRHTPEGGAIVVSCSARAAEARVSVRDTGTGIPADHLTRVFERFYRADKGRSVTPSTGTGIGLALCKELIELHGGTIEVTSDAAQGATFVVTLPLPAGTADQDATATALDARASGALDDTVEATKDTTVDEEETDDVTTVLVVDDNPDLRAWIRRHIEPAFRVVEAVDGKDGLERAREVLPDLVISDVMMPRMDGHELCQALRADVELETTPVILLTAKAESDDRVDGLALGADDYLTKPFEPRELLARVENLIEGRRRLREQLRRGEILRPRAPEVPSGDEQFLARVREAVEANLDGEPFGVADLAEALAMSRGHLHRRLTGLLGRSPLEIMRGIRLDRAAQLLRSRAGNVSEVAYATGFQSVSHFCRSFRERFGCTPAMYRAGENSDKKA
jgi:signal transduction histidine kinase/CheY-like chemotaxis protein/AraC-like DNA-binding protein